MVLADTSLETDVFGILSHNFQPYERVQRMQRVSLAVFILSKALCILVETNLEETLHLRMQKRFIKQDRKSRPNPKRVAGIGCFADPALYANYQLT